MNADLPPPPPPPPPAPPAQRSAYFVPPPPPPPPPPGPSPFAGLGVLAATLGVLVAVGIAGIFGWQAYKSRHAGGGSSDDISDEHRKDSKKDSVDHHAGKEAAHLPILETDPVRGGDAALVTIVSFEDFQCPFCGRVETTLNALQKKYGGDLRFVWKDEPLPFHTMARPAAKDARVAFLARGPKAFWGLHDAIYADQKSISGTSGTATLETWAASFGADATALSRFGAQADGLIDDSDALAKEIGASGTPTFFIDGEKLVGAQPQEKFEEVIDAHLAEAKKLVASGTAPEDVYAKLVDAHWAEEATPAGPTYAVDVAGAPQWGPPDALVTVVVFGDLETKPSSTDVSLRSIAGMPDTRLVWRDRPATANGRQAAEVVRLIGKRFGDASRLDALEDIRAPGFVLDPSGLVAVGTKYGLSASDVTTAMGIAASDADIDDDLDHADEVSAASGTALFVNGQRLYSFDKAGFTSAHKSALKRAKALVASGTAPADVYAKTIAGGTKSPRRHATLAVPAWAPTRGPASAPVTIQVFADFQCPFCARAMTGDFAKVVAAHASDVRVVFRETPLPFHALAEPAAETAIEAKAQKGVASFWRVHDALFLAESKSTLSSATIDAIAAAEGLDMTKVHAAQSAHTHKKEIDDDGADAKSIGISGTPNFLVGDEIVTGAMPAAAFEAAIRRQLAKLKPPSAIPIK